MKDVFCVAICDDEELICQEISACLEPYIQSSRLTAETFSSGEALYEAIASGRHFDLIFLDIELDLMDGVAVGRKIREELCNETVHIVFISGKPEYALKLFPIHPLHFLTKPFARQEVVDVLEKAMRLSVICKKTFEFKTGGTLHRIPYGDILYFESLGRKVCLHTEKEEYAFYDKINHIEEKTQGYFLRIHQSYLINPLGIAHYAYNQVQFLNSQILPVSESYRISVKKEILKIWNDL